MTDLSVSVKKTTEKHTFVVVKTRFGDRYAPNVKIIIANPEWGFDDGPYKRAVPIKNWCPSTKGTEIQITCNGPLRLTLAQLKELVATIEDTKAVHFDGQDKLF